MYEVVLYEGDAEVCIYTLNTWVEAIEFMVKLASTAGAHVTHWELRRVK